MKEDFHTNIPPVSIYVLVFPTGVITQSTPSQLSYWFINSPIQLVLAWYSCLICNFSKAQPPINRHLTRYGVPLWNFVKIVLPSQCSLGFPGLFTRDANPRERELFVHKSERRHLALPRSHAGKKFWSTWADFKLRPMFQSTFKQPC